MRVELQVATVNRRPTNDVQIMARNVESCGQQSCFVIRATGFDYRPIILNHVPAMIFKAGFCSPGKGEGRSSTL
jgi:hypothetical protein